MPPLPLLRLPGVVLCEVFKSMSIGEKIQLSLCSKKISTQINNARLYSQKVIVDLDILNQKVRVLSENDGDIFEIFPYPDSVIGRNLDASHFHIAGCSVPVISVPAGIEIFWKTHQEAFLISIRYLLKIFQCKISTVIYFRNSDMYQLVISELLDLQLAFKKITFYYTGLEDQSMLWNQVSNKLGLVEDFVILPVINPDFRPVFTSWSQNILITSSAWFTLDYLLACTRTTITLFQSFLGNKELDVILRSWMAGKLPNLSCLRFDSLRTTDNGATILGMNLRELSGKVFQTDDGSKKATLRIRGIRVVMTVTSF